MKEVTVTELKKMIDDQKDFQLIDVREEHEADVASIGGTLIPMGDIMDNMDKISKEKQVVVYCRTGNRSGQITQFLEKNHGYSNVYNLKGGITAWAKEIDPAIPIY